MAELKLTPNAKVGWRLTPYEYFFAAAGTSGNGHAPMNVTFVLQGDTPGFDTDVWQRALDRASAANSGSRLRIKGALFWAQWTDDGAPPRLRVVEEILWDGSGKTNSDFINAEQLDLIEGPAAELILVKRSPIGPLVVFRASHAVMDGMGAYHFLSELFRALRGEPLMGSNAEFSALDIMRKVAPPKPSKHDRRIDWPTGDARGNDTTIESRTVVIEGSTSNIVGRLAAAIAEYTHRHSSRDALIAVPVDLRRHVPGILSTANYTGMLFVPMKKGEGPDEFRQKLRALLSEKKEAYHIRMASILKLIPFKWLDRIMDKGGRKKLLTSPMHTAMVSKVGHVDRDQFSFDGFQLRRYFGFGNHPGMVGVMGTDAGIELNINLPAAVASNGRFDDFVSYLRRRLVETDPAQ
ncbi:MAG: hypothetical protein M9944_07785 [Rhizobiaceae bacterium]|nr:hypothetical protein [Rhizobiaceae bacterium]